MGKAQPKEEIAQAHDEVPKGGKRGASSWIEHVKAVRAKEGCSYKEAMIKAKATWKK
jgi:hypothetical protein